jgi:hypothetical protein
MSERDPGHAAGVPLVVVATRRTGYASHMSKLMVAGAFAAGYVLGAKAGRERYEEIRRAYEKFAGNPRVKEVVFKVEDQVMNLYNDSPASGDGVAPANRAERT